MKTHKKPVGPAAVKEYQKQVSPAGVKKKAASDMKATNKKYPGLYKSATPKPRTTSK